MATKLIVIKITDGKDIRRFTANVDDLTYTCVTKYVQDMFNLWGKVFRMKYKDDEGDLITVSTDVELSEAVEIALKQDPSVLRISIVAEDHAPSVSSFPQPDVSSLLSEIASKLPEMMASLPESVQRMIPNAELDVAASLNATNQANRADQANDVSFAAMQEAVANGTTPLKIHHGVTCDGSGMCPIIGERYHKRGENYDLCSAEFEKLSPDEKAKYEIIPPRPLGSRPCPSLSGLESEDKGFHQGVVCDRSGMCPIVGNRYTVPGKNYDLCEAEYAKLSEKEKAHFRCIPPPQAKFPPAGPFGRAGCGWGGRHRQARFASGDPTFPKFAARFVRDVSIFDGTQMPPGTKFTKIWRLKNVGEAPWPPGTRMLFVGGDQMSADMSVPISADGPVMPGQETDVAVEMVAPMEMGRYLGNWRLTGPMMKRRFGQRVWCHVQVVDPSKPPTEAEIASMIAQASMSAQGSPAANDDEDAYDNDEGDEPEGVEKGDEPEVNAPSTSLVDSEEVKFAAEPTKSKAQTEDSAWPPSCNESDEEVVVVARPPTGATETTAAAAPAAAANLVAVVACAGAHAAPSVEKSAVDEAKERAGAELFAMGFADTESIALVLHKNGADVQACASDLSLLTKWSSQLTDLVEMGFADSDKNKLALLKHGGSIKASVRDLVSGA